jgi:hypothetical protein
MSTVPFSMGRPISSEVDQPLLMESLSIGRGPLLLKRSPYGRSVIPHNNQVSKEWITHKVNHPKNEASRRKWQRRLKAYNSPEARLAYDEADLYEQKEMKYANQGIDRQDQIKAWRALADYKS